MKNKTVLRGGLALAAALVLAIALLAGTAKPHLYPVLVVTQPVPAGAQVAATDLGTLFVAVVPAGALTNPGAVAGQYAQVPLYPGDTLTASQIGQPFGPGTGQVQVVVPVSPAESALANVGQTVAVYGSTTSTDPNHLATVKDLVPRAKVTGIYTSAAVAITPQAPGTPALVSLAVTPAQAAQLLPYLAGQGGSVWLVALP